MFDNKTQGLYRLPCLITLHVRLKQYILLNESNIKKPSNSLHMRLKQNISNK